MNNNIDVDLLESQFGSPLVQDGIDQIAELLNSKAQPDGSDPPDHEPWRTIYTTMTTSILGGVDHNSAWQNAISLYPVDIQFELTKLIQAAMQEIADAQEAAKSRKRIKTKQYLNQFKKLGYSFHLNTCDDSIVVEHNQARQRMDDLLFSQIYRGMADAGNYTQDDTQHCINIDARRNAFHPIRDYLKQLAWDGQPHIETLSNYFVDKDGVFRLWLRRWMIGAVARVFREGAQNAMLVLDGPQNIGKSTFVRWLCPIPGAHVESPIAPDNKDDFLKLITKWIWEVTELGSTVRKSDIEALKGFLTTEYVTVRPPYGRYALHKPALASFVGTINNSGGFLNDPTGSRRFNVCTVTQIDWGYQSLDIHQVWAEAYAAFVSGERWNLSPDEQKLRDSINDSYQVDDPVELAIYRFFEIDNTRLDWWLPTIDIIKILEDPYNGGIRSGSTLSTARAVAQTMAKLGCQKGRKQHGQLRGYTGIRIKP